jgi:hypothetical protein
MSDNAINSDSEKWRALSHRFSLRVMGNVGCC